MKAVRIASTVRHIEESDTTITLFRIQEILSEHRSTLIAGVLGDLSTYLQFKFYAKVDKDQQDTIRDKLAALSHEKVNLDRYHEIVEEIKRNTSYRVPYQDFFREIDTLLDAQLNPAQLQLMP